MLFSPLTKSKLQSSKAFLNRARQGLLKGTVSTPSYILPTNLGIIPGIMNMNLPEISPVPVQFSLADIYHLREVIEKYQSDYPSLSSQTKNQNEPNPLLSYLNHQKDTVSLLTMSTCGSDKILGNYKTMEMDIPSTIHPGNKNRLSLQDFSAAIATFKPDLFITPTHSITAKTSKKKRERAVKTSREYINPSVLNLVKDRGPQALMTISIEESYPKISPIIDEKISQFGEKISGYFFNTHSLKPQTRLGVFQKFYERYPTDEKLRVLESSGNPTEVLENLVLNGIDLFEARYPIDVSEKHHCLAFDTEMPNEWRSTPVDTEFIKESLSNPTKTPRTLDLSRSEFRKDSTVLTPGSKSPLTNSITRSYIHHLLDCKEMNASILLTIHNIHVYDNFFKAVRSHIADNTLEIYTQWFLQTQCK
ncbi:unnamed protein product [Moneuplotes crassus]|uniref:tRNA-guanine(15) transglycosylase-like domain-containing protein n=1 Tax=Euplotes crassus TaxID=5936 RepID=A0AAD1XF42_EUPCR|nr:unnamed protein product [Moneuplotes crassus]